MSRLTDVQGDKCPGGQMSGGQLSEGPMSGGHNANHHPLLYQSIAPSIFVSEFLVKTYMLEAVCTFYPLIFSFPSIYLRIAQSLIPFIPPMIQGVP